MRSSSSVGGCVVDTGTQISLWSLGWEVSSALHGCGGSAVMAECRLERERSLGLLRSRRTTGRKASHGRWPPLCQPSTLPALPPQPNLTHPVPSHTHRPDSTHPGSGTTDPAAAQQPTHRSTVYDVDASACASRRTDARMFALAPPITAAVPYDRAGGVRRVGSPARGGRVHVARGRGGVGDGLESSGSTEMIPAKPTSQLRRCACGSAAAGNV